VRLVLFYLKFLDFFYYYKLGLWIFLSKI
jgi:hypothetical protein